MNVHWIAQRREQDRRDAVLAEMGKAWEQFRRGTLTTGEYAARVTHIAQNAVTA